MKKERGITMVSLVVTIIILIILAGISINVTIGDNGLITKAKQSKQNILLAGEAEAIQLNQLYHDLEASGSLTEDEESTKKDEIIALLQKQVEELQKQVASLQTENAELQKQIADLTNKIASLQQEIADLKQQIANKDIEIAELKKQVSEKEEKIKELQNELNNLKSLLAQTNATADKILTGYKAYSGGQLVTGTMPNNVSTANVPNDKAWLYNNRVYFGVPYGYYPPANFGEMTNVSERYITYASLASTIGLANHKLAVGQSVLGVNGTYTSDATATANNLSSGTTAYVNGQKITGNGADVNNAYNNGYNAGIAAGGTGKYTLVELGTGTSFDVKSIYPNYANLTASNFICQVVSISVSGSATDNDAHNSSYNGGFSVTPSLSYNASTGVVTIGGTSNSRSYKTWGNTGTVITATATVKVYLKY